MSEEENIRPVRKSGQGIGNPNPPAFVLPPHEGHKADKDSWMRTKNIRYKKRMAKQRLLKGDNEKWMEQLLTAHHD